VTFIQFKICWCVQNFMKIGWFFAEIGPMAIYRISKWRPSAILELFYHHTRPPMKSLLLAAAACQISRQSDTQIWRYSCLNFPHIWPIQAPKMGILWDFEPINVTIHHRDTQKAHPCVNPRLLSYFYLIFTWMIWPKSTAVSKDFSWLFMLMTYC